MTSEKLSDNLSGTLIFVEGIPGSGKTTRLHDLSKSIAHKYDCRCFWEETSQPLDLFRQAVVREDEWSLLKQRFLSGHPEHESELNRWIKNNSYLLNNYRIIAYLQLCRTNGVFMELFSALKAYDIGEGRVSFDTYEKYHRMLWHDFAANLYDRKTVYLSEGSLFHGQLLDLIGFYELDDDALLQYYTRLYDELRPIPCTVEYIYVKNIRSLIKETNAARDGWQEQLNNWLLHAPWSIKNNYSGIDGTVHLYEKIRNLQLTLMRELAIPFTLTNRE